MNSSEQPLLMFQRVSESWAHLWRAYSILVLNVASPMVPVSDMACFVLLSNSRAFFISNLYGAYLGIDHKFIITWRGTRYS